MPRSRSTQLQWGAIVALALLALAPALHSHATADEHDDACAFCHAYGSAVIASITEDKLDPTFGGEPHAQAPWRIRNAELMGYGPRAPPA